MADFGTSFTDAFIGIQKLGLQRRQIAAEEARANAAETRAVEQQNWQREAHDRAAATLKAFSNVNQYDVKPDAQGALSAADYNARFAPTKVATPSVAGEPTEAPAKKPAAMPAPQITAPATPAPQAAGMPTPTMAGNIDTSKQPIVQNPDGTHSTVSTMGFDIDGKYVNLPTISPEGKRLTPAEAVEEYRRTGRNLGVYNNREEGDAAAQQLHENEQVRTEGLPATVNAAAQPQPEKQLTRDDYVRVNRDGQEMYVPKNAVTKRDTSTVFREMAESIQTLDPETSARMMSNALDLESKNIKATADRYGAAVMSARRAYEASPAEGAKALQAAWSLMPNMTDVTVTPSKDGKLTVQHFTTHGGKQVPVGEAETMSADQLFRKAASLSTPDAMRQYSMDEAAAAQRMLENNLNERQFAETVRSHHVSEGQGAESLGIQRARLRQEGGGDSGLKYTSVSETLPNGSSRLVMKPNKPGGVPLVEGPYGEFMPRMWADNPQALNKVKQFVSGIGAGYKFDQQGNAWWFKPNGEQGRIKTVPKK